MPTMELGHDTAETAQGGRLTTASIAMGATAERSAFHNAVAAVERHRKFVLASVAIALVARLLLEFNLIALVQQRANLIVQVPYIGMALLAYLLVLMWMGRGAGDRVGFGMALGLGVIETAFLIVTAMMQRPFDLSIAWRPLVVGVAHLPMAVFALSSARDYPPQDSKKPWLTGFVVALAMLAIPWVAGPILQRMGW
jgi:hypothetical protein